MTLTAERKAEIKKERNTDSHYWKETIAGPIVDELLAEIERLQNELDEKWAFGVADMMEPILQEVDRTKKGDQK